MNREMLFRFLNAPQPDTMDSLRKTYKDDLEDTIVSFINAETTKTRGSLIDVLNHAIEISTQKLGLMYTKPATKFAATFIGHYNILPAADFGALVGEKLNCQDVAFRPEVVEISPAPLDGENRFLWKGVVEDSLSHGNILRYTISCGALGMDVDVLFRNSTVLEDGQEVYLSMKRDSCILL